MNTLSSPRFISLILIAIVVAGLIGSARAENKPPANPCQSVSAAVCRD
jgi:hypothetical protein